MDKPFKTKLSVFCLDAGGKALRENIVPVQNNSGEKLMNQKKKDEESG